MSESKSSATLAYAIRSFMGYLEGTQKAAHTIRSYRSDLATFSEFLDGAPISEIGLQDLERYHEFLKQQGMSTNTRRRKVLTVRRLMNYLHKRGKVTIDVSARVPAPYKVERVPQVFSTASMVERIRALPGDTASAARDRLLLWTLAETGAQVSEVSRLKFSDFELDAQGAQGWVQISGKAPRRLPISPELAFEAARQMELAGHLRPWAFSGYHRAQPLDTPISDRAVELLARAYAERLGVPGLTPRAFRHSVVVLWNQNGLSRPEIRERLGLKTDYAFRAYEPLFKLDAARHGG
jgi:integrase/recombinase XerD